MYKFGLATVAIVGEIAPVAVPMVLRFEPVVRAPTGIAAMNRSPG